MPKDKYVYPVPPQEENEIVSAQTKNDEIVRYQLGTENPVAKAIIKNNVAEIPWKYLLCKK